MKKSVFVTEINLPLKDRRGRELNLKEKRRGKRKRKSRSARERERGREREARKSCKRRRRRRKRRRRRDACNTNEAFERKSHGDWPVVAQAAREAEPGAGRDFPKLC